MTDEILEILEEDARRTPEEVATMLGRPVDEVRGAIEDLERRGVILKYKAVVNEERLDRGTVTAVIEIKVTPERQQGFDSIAERIARFPEVRDCYLISGDYDLIASIEGPGIREVAEFVARKVATMNGVAGTRTHFLLKKYKDGGEYLFDDESQPQLPVTP